MSMITSSTIASLNERLFPKIFFPWFSSQITSLGMHMHQNKRLGWPFNFWPPSYRSSSFWGTNNKSKSYGTNMDFNCNDQSINHSPISSSSHVFTLMSIVSFAVGPNCYKVLLWKKKNNCHKVQAKRKRKLTPSQDTFYFWLASTIARYLCIWLEYCTTTSIF